MSSLGADKAALAKVMSQPGTFLWGALKAFRANQGVLLAGAVAYDTLLSIVPLFALQASDGAVPFLHFTLHLEGVVAFGLYLLGVLGLVLLLTSFYVVMPVGRISWRRAAP